MDSTYTPGLRFKCLKDITKNDIIVLCDLLAANYNDGLCSFQPEGITEGGIEFVFNANCPSDWYKSVRLCVYSGTTAGKWYWVDKANVMTEWENNDDLIFQKNTHFHTFLKSFNGAPIFTIEELTIWVECFDQIGIRKVGKYPTKKSLIDKM
jgi:hypothetical protein